MKLPQENVIAVMFTASEKGTLVNKIAKMAIDQGVPITEGMVIDSTSSVPITGPKWATSIPPGMTAVSIPASRIALAAYAVADGAHVNVAGCFQFVDVDPVFQTLLPNETAALTSTGFLPDTLTALTLKVSETEEAKFARQGRVELDPSLQQPYYLVPSERYQRPRLVCQMLLQDAVVLKVGNFGEAAPVQGTPAPNNQQQQPPARDLVTLIVTPQDAVTLTYLIYADAQVSLTLRNPSDQARQATEAATLQFLLSQYNIPVPAKLPYSMEMNFIQRDNTVYDLRLDVTEDNTPSTLKIDRK
jgi:pilus assembly protein CpaB